MSEVQHLIDKKGRLWQERTITIKPNDTAGYGFSLSGEKPVFVDSVVEGGPSHKSGIKCGDRIIKVDGQSVFDKKHSDVVNLLKGATCVSLTIITQVYSNTEGRREHGELSAPQRIQELTVHALKTMLNKQEKMFEQLTIDYTKGPCERLEQELKDCEEIIKTLQGEIAVKSSTTVETITQTTESTISSLLGSDRAHQRTGRLARDDSVLAHKILNTMYNSDSEQLPSQLNSQSHDHTRLTPSPSIPTTSSSPTKFKSPRMFRRSSLTKLLMHSTTSTSDNPNSGSSSPTKQMHRSFSGLNDSDLSDEDLEFGIRQFGPFTSLQELNNYPAHMSVFLHFLIQNRDPRYLCFYLVARSYQNFYKGNELRQKALEILWTFCLLTSPLYVPLRDSILQKLLETLESDDNEIKLKSIFVEARDFVANQIAEDLAEYRHKRTLGLGSLYGEQKLTDHMTASRELDVANSTLTKVLKDLINEKPDSVEEVNTNQALCDAISTFLLDISKGKAKSDSSVGDRMQSFTRSESNKRKNKVKKFNRCGHNLQLSSYNRTYMCDHCERVLWGIHFHGYQCTVCEMNFHRYGCVDDPIDVCLSKKGFRRKSLNIRRTSGGQQSVLSVVSDLEKSEGNDDYPDIQEEEEKSINKARLRSVSDPKNTLMAVQLVREEEIVREQVYQKKQHKSHATVGRTQSLKEHRTGSEGHPQSSQDTSLNTTPSWNSVASSSNSMSDESLNTSSSLTSGGAPLFPVGSVSKISTLDTVVETGLVTKTSLMDDHVLQELQDANVEDELIPWRLTTKAQVVKSLQQFEIQRQELLKELVHTERTHFKKLQIMRHIYKTPLSRQNILPHQQIEQLFPSLEELVTMHYGLCSDMRERQGSYSDGVVTNMADILLKTFEGPAGERLCHACTMFASNQGRAIKLLKELSKNPKFRKFTQDAESDPYCNRLTLKELLPIVWTRLTRYQLLIENICKLNKKYSSKIEGEDKEEAERMETALQCIKNICRYVNKQVKLTENVQRLRDHQSKLDTSQLEKTTHPIAEKYKDLNLTSESRRMLHEGPLIWKITHRRSVEVHALLLTDILVLLSKPEDGSDKLSLKRYHIETIGGVREEISAVIRIKEMILRHFASDKGGRSFLVVNNSPLMKLAQMYEFSAESVQEKKKWEEAIEKAMKGTTTGIISPEPNSPLDNSFHRTVAFTPLMSNIELRDQLNKIDDDIQKLLVEKMEMLRALQGLEGTYDSVESLTQPTGKEYVEIKDITGSVLETSAEITAEISKLMVPNPTKHIIADVQYQISELTSHLQRNLSRVLLYLSDLIPTSQNSSESLIQSDDRNDEYYPVTTSTPQFEHISDTTVSPLEDQSVSTPQATPLPGTTYSTSNPEKIISFEIQEVKSSDSLPQYLLEDDDDDDNEIPPPLPEIPPPSSSSSTSSPSGTPEDSLTLDSLLPPINSQLSMCSEDFHSESLTGIIDPPKAFSKIDLSPTKDSTVLFPNFTIDESEDIETLRSSPVSTSPPKQNESFRRVRSNPSLTNLKVKMSVISASGKPISERIGMKRTLSEDVPAPNTREPLNSIQSVDSK